MTLIRLKYGWFDYTQLTTIKWIQDILSILHVFYLHILYQKPVCAAKIDERSTNLNSFCDVPEESEAFPKSFSDTFGSIIGHFQSHYILTPSLHPAPVAFRTEVKAQHRTGRSHSMTGIEYQSLMFHPVCLSHLLSCARMQSP